MAQVLIRNLDDDVLASYRDQASHNNRSLEAELRTVLTRYRPMAADRRIAAVGRLAALRAMTFDVIQTPAEHLVREDRDGFRDA